MDLTEHTYLFTVDDIFSITGRGVVLVPGISRQGGTVVRRGSPLILRTPLGRIIETSIRDLEMVCRTDGQPTEHSPVLLPSDLGKSDVPIGTEVFLGQVPEEKPGDRTSVAPEA